MTEMEMLRKICTAYEDELKKRMTPEEFDNFSTGIARVLFAEDVIGMADGDFKETCMEHFAALTGSDEDFLRLMRSFGDGLELDDPGDLGDEDY